MAAGDVAGAVRVGEGVVKEVNWGGVCGASWASLFGIFLKLKSCLCIKCIKLHVVAIYSVQ